MKKYLKYPAGALIGAAYAALPVLLSRLLIAHLAELFGWIGSLASLDESTLAYGAQILSQLKSASVISPWLPFLLTGAVLEPVILRLTGGKNAALFLTLGLLLLLPFALLALWFTSVNDIRVGALIQSILPILSHIL